MPRERGFDHTFDLLRDPYRFISRSCARLGTDVFEARILLRPTICMSGREAAQVFYDPDRLMRQGAAPLRPQKSLDDAAQRQRKPMFTSILSRERVAALLQRVENQWREHQWKWRVMNEVRLYPELQSLLTRAVLEWSGAPPREARRALRARQLAVSSERAGSVGPRHWSARSARQASERWIGHLIEDIRAGRWVPPVGSAADSIARHREADGTLLAPEVAAVELLNVLRPTVAISVFISFVALALHEHPEWRQRLASADERSIEMFVQEVRRFYPFFPAAIARVRQDFEWHGCHFRRGRRVLLDLYGTDHDARIWERPEEFRPERFGDWSGDAFGRVPQGGDPVLNQRRAGEWVTIEIMKLAARRLARMRYTVPPQDLAVDFSRLPALPRSGFVVHVEPR
jgi:fatty-acid peroxygenase